MLKITVVDGQRRRRLVVEGRLVAPWTAELASACQAAKSDLQNRKLVVDLRNLTAISPEGEDLLLQLMREKVKLVSGVYLKEVLRQLVRKTRRNPPDWTDE